MHLQAEEGAIPHQCPHPLTSDARQLTLLRTRTQSQRASNREVTRPRQTGLLRWVVIHKSCANVLSTSFPQDAQIWPLPMRGYADQPSLFQDGVPTLTATELREKLLREKVKALRKSSITQKEIDIDEG